MMSPAPSAPVCAIVPTYNRAMYLGVCLDSLLAQTYPLARILVVNDGSTDGTAALLRTYAAKHPVITVIDKANGGKSSALNVGLAACPPDAAYIWICDDDDVALPDGLAALVHALDADPEAGLAYGHCRHLVEKDGQRLVTEPVYWPRTSEPDPKIRFLEAMFTNQFAMLVRRSLYDTVGPFAEDMVWAEDYEMTLRLTRWAKAVYVPHVIFLYRQHTGARGCASDRIEGENRYGRWLEASRTIGRTVLNTYALEEFCPTFARAWTDPHKRRRACLLERGCALAHNSLWSEAAQDWTRAAAEAGETPLTPEEIELLEVAVFNEIHWDVLPHEHAAIRQLRAVHDSSVCGRVLTFALFRRTPRMIFRRWVKERSPLRGWLLLKTMLNVLGMCDALRRCLTLSHPLPLKRTPVEASLCPLARQREAPRQLR